MKWVLLLAIFLTGCNTFPEAFGAQNETHYNDVFRKSYADMDWSKLDSGFTISHEVAGPFAFHAIAGAVRAFVLHTSAMTSIAIDLFWGGES